MNSTISSYREPIITRKSPLILLYKIVGTVLFFNITFLLISVGYAYLRQYNGPPRITEVTLFLILFLIEVLVFLYHVIRWFSEYIMVDSHFVLHKKGIIFTKECRYKLDTINNMTVDQDPITKFLRYGNIRISHSNDEIALLYSIPYPNQLIYLIEQKIEILQHRIHEE